MWSLTNSEWVITVLAALCLGVGLGLLRRYVVFLVTALIVAVLVEAFCASTKFFYKFGDGLFTHLCLALAVGTAAFVVAYIIRKAVSESSKPRPSLFTNAPTGSDKRIVIAAHAAGFLYLIPFLGVLVCGALYFANRSKSAFVLGQIKDAGTFQLAFNLLFIALIFLPKGVPFIAVSAPITLLYFVFTIIAIIKSCTQGYYHYPIISREIIEHDNRVADVRAA